MQIARERPTAKIQTPAFLDIAGIDMYAQGNELITEVPLPEFKQDEVEVTATSEGMEISAIRKVKVDEPKDRTYYLHEGRCSYWRRVGLPPAARPEELKYVMRGGRLRITMPIDRVLISDRQATNKREEASHVYRNTAQNKQPAAIGFSDQEFPNHWTRYRPAR